MANLIETLDRQGSFTTLLSALRTAGLTDLLQTPGPYTLLAPPDPAFNQIDDLEALIQDGEKLKRVLSYHVVSGDVRSDDLAQIDEAPTMEGSILAVDHNGTVKVNDAQVTQMDILSDNGVIHVIDRILVPALIAGHS